MKATASIPLEREDSMEVIQIQLVVYDYPQ